MFKKTAKIYYKSQIYKSMFYQIHEIININLELLFLSKNQSLKFSEFKDKNGEKLEEMIEFFQIMEKQKLIEIENNNCNLTEFGKEIAKNGGWFNHLEKIKEIEIEKKPNVNHSKKTKKKLKRHFIDKKSFAFLTNRFKNILKIK